MSLEQLRLRRHTTLPPSCSIPYEHVDYYDAIVGRCTENVVGYVPIPLGVAGPLVVDGRAHHVPMATVEGCLVASTARGCKALARSGGVVARVLRRHMTRAPVLQCTDLEQAVAVRAYVEDDAGGRAALEACVASTSRYAKFERASVHLAGSLAYVRIACDCADAMGMNMTSKATEAIVAHLVERFPGLRCLALSGNLCCDKKSAAINWIDGRGCHVVCEARLPRDVVREVFKTTPEALVEVHVSKNLVGGAMAGASGGGFNAHAANIVAAIFAACGQDLAQVGTSAMCLTHMRVDADGVLIASCTMPNVEVGVVGGGTHLPPQRACLRLLCGGSTGASSGDTEEEGRDGVTPETVARVLCSAVLAAELSLLAALTTHTLVQAHMALNRAK